MFAITIDYLTGVCYANERAAGRPGVPEWPPHPERLFQALVASSTERDNEALRWIAAQPAPSIVAGEAKARHTLSMFSPANDKLPSRNQVTQKKKEMAPYTSTSVSYRVDRIRAYRQRAERHVVSTVP
ncbi:MAG: type I-U CRISPR-associated protein Cas5/Cas6, partial [Pirellulales bacterium]|nr:type I-U CRISPR-associated protein Cas5/Cas6 [Pirellulales bacterium]